MLYFVMRAAVARLGGINETSKKLGVSKMAVASWVAQHQRTRPDAPVLEQLAGMSGVPLEALEAYYQRLDTYRGHEYFRRRRPG